MQEFPVFQKSWNKNIKQISVVYPNKYYGGVYSLALLILYNTINQKENHICTRHFLDKFPINANLIGFSFQHELDYFNFFKILKDNKIPINKKRKQIIFAGGPCVNMNYKPLQSYIDFFVIGEAENPLQEILKINTKNKQQFLEEVSDIPGIFVPSIPKKISFATTDLNKSPYPLVQPFPDKIDEKFVFGKVFILETERGCTFHCKFCPISKIHQKIKIRNLKNIKEIIDQGIKINNRKKVIIYSPSFIHPKRKEILQYLIDKNLEFSVPSLKVEVIDKELLELIKAGKQKTLTIAPECNELLRKEIGKPISDKEFFNFTDLANSLKFETLKLYFMIGLPNQKPKDLDETINFIKKAKEKFKRKVHISINPFVPKPKTEFSDFKFNKDNIKRQANYIKKHLKLKIKIQNINLSYQEWKLAFTKKIKSPF